MDVWWSQNDRDDFVSELIVVDILDLVAFGVWTDDEKLVSCGFYAFVSIDFHWNTEKKDPTRKWNIARANLNKQTNSARYFVFLPSNALFRFQCLWFDLVFLVFGYRFSCWSWFGGWFFSAGRCCSCSRCCFFLFCRSRSFFRFFLWTHRKQRRSESIEFSIFIISRMRI